MEYNFRTTNFPFCLFWFAFCYLVLIYILSKKQLKLFKQCLKSGTNICLSFLFSYIVWKLLLF